MDQQVDEEGLFAQLSSFLGLNSERLPEELEGVEIYPQLQKTPKIPASATTVSDLRFEKDLAKKLPSDATAARTPESNSSGEMTPERSGDGCETEAAVQNSPAACVQGVLPAKQEPKRVS